MEEARDESMFRAIFSGSQTALLVHIKAINMYINDSLRNMFENFLNDELKMYNGIIKYGKPKVGCMLPLNISIYSEGMV